MKELKRLYDKAKQYRRQGNGEKRAFVCRNYISSLGGKWECLIDTIRNNKPPTREEKYFDTQEDAIKYAESRLDETEYCIVSNI